jgi:hypothetical protein
MDQTTTYAAAASPVALTAWNLAFVIRDVSRRTGEKNS